MKKKYFSSQETRDTTQSMFGVNFVPKRPNVWVFSLDDTKMAWVKENMCTAPQEDEIPIRKRFSKWVYENHDKVLTEKQMLYINDCLCGLEFQNYKFNARYDYRQRMQKVIMAGYFNNPNMQYYRRLDTDLEKHNIIRKLHRRATTNKGFVGYILDNINTPYIMELLFEGRVSSTCRKHIMWAFASKDSATPYIPKAHILSELYDVVLSDIEGMKNIINSHKKK